MLVNLLPGIRELRTPLTAGYLWLVAGWLAFAHRIPSAYSANGLWGDIYRLGEGIGTPGALAAASFVAYVIGILNERLSRLLTIPLLAIRGLIRLRISSLPHFTLRDVVGDVMVQRYWDSKDFRNAIAGYLTPAKLADYVRLIQADDQLGLSPRREDSLRDINPDMIEKSSLEDHSAFNDAYHRIIAAAEVNEAQLRDLLEWVIDTMAMAKSLEEDLPLIPARLVGKEPEIYERWDRLQAEAEFRFSIVPPLLALILLLANRLGFSYLLAILPCLYLQYEGFRKQREATAQLAESLRAGRAPSPVLDRLRTGEPQWSRR
jgi:hypothetical protein